MRPRPRSRRMSSSRTVVAEVVDGAAELVGDVLLGLRKAQAPGHLHAGHQISGSPHPAIPPRRARVTRPSRGIPDPHLQPVDCRCRRGRDARDVASTGGYGVMGTPPTPTCRAYVHGDGGCGGHRLDERAGARGVPGERLRRVDVHRRSEDRGAGGLAGLELAERPLAGQPRALVLELRACVPARARRPGRSRRRCRATCRGPCGPCAAWPADQRRPAAPAVSKSEDRRLRRPPSLRPPATCRA